MNDWKLQLKMLLEKQGLSPDNPEDEASQQISCEQENFISDLLHSERQSILNAVKEVMSRTIKEVEKELGSPNVYLDMVEEVFNERLATEIESKKEREFREFIERVEALPNLEPENWEEPPLESKEGNTRIIIEEKDC